MSTEARIAANQFNAQASTGPRTPEGKARSARNAAKLGLFSLHCLVTPDQKPDYLAIVAGIWTRLLPEGAFEESFAIEIVRATWRLQRCARVEGDLLDSLIETGLDPMQNEATLKIQTSVDRARAQCNGIIRRALAELRRLQTDRHIANELIGGNEPVPALGIASAKEITAAVASQNKAKMFRRKLDDLDNFTKLLDRATAPPRAAYVNPSAEAA